MSLPQFKLLRPKSIEEAVEFLARNASSPAVNFRLIASFLFASLLAEQILFRGCGKNFSSRNSFSTCAELRRYVALKKILGATLKSAR